MNKRTTIVARYTNDNMSACAFETDQFAGFCKIT